MSSPQARAVNPAPTRAGVFGHSADAAMSRKQALQPHQADPGEHGNEQWPLCDRRRRCGQRIELLGFDRQQLQRCCPDLTSSLCIGRKQMHP